MSRNNMTSIPVRAAFKPKATIQYLLGRLDFKSKKIRVNLNQPIKAEVKAETAEVLKNVDEDRKYVIQATIVRYVYARSPPRRVPKV